MKKYLFVLILLGSSLVSMQAPAGLLYNYSQLAVKDLDQMSKIVQEKVHESRKSKGEKVIPLREGLQAIFSRPNSDDMIEKVMSPLKNALEEDGLWEESVKKLVDEALGALKNPKAFQPVVQVTYLVFLENLVSEFKPRANSEFENKILLSIRNAKIQISKEARHERVLRMMKEGTSPSVFAEEALKEGALKAEALKAEALKEEAQLKEEAKRKETETKPKGSDAKPTDTEAPPTDSQKK